MISIISKGWLLKVYLGKIFNMRGLMMSLLLVSMSFVFGQVRNTISVHDKTFVDRAAQTGISEVEFGKLAQEKGEFQFIKTYGFKMEIHHAELNRELEDLAALKNLTFPIELAQDKQRKLNELSMKSELDFDNSFIDLMIEEHENAIGLFEAHLQNGENLDLKKWVEKKLPALKEHLDEAREIKNYLQQR